MNSQTITPTSPRHDACVTATSRPAVPTGRQRILVVDDENNIRDFMSRVLVSSGLDVTTAADGEQAWKLLRQARYDLLITDHDMPRLTGLGLVQRIRAAGMGLPIIIVSGLLAGELASNRLHHISAVISKPFTVSEFLNQVSKTLEVPREKAAANQEIIFSKPQPSESKPARSRVLIVDDDDQVRDSLAAVLESEGYEVDEAISGMEAVSRTIENHPDLVLLDLNMPHCDGWTAFSQLDRITPLVPVIVVTARPNQYAKAVQLGVDAFMEKPLNIPVLVRAVKDYTNEDENGHVRRITNPAFVTELLDNNCATDIPQPENRS